MKRNVSAIVILAFFLSTIPLPAQQAAPRTAKPYVAVMDIRVDEGIPKTLGKAISDTIRQTLMSTGKFVLIDRGNIEIIMEEIGRGQMGCFDESCAVEAGRLLSAHFIVTGSLVKLGENECQLSAQMTDVAKAEIVKVATDRSTCEGAALTSAAQNVALDLAGVPRTPGKLVIQSTPSGGIVFIDGERKGNTPFDVEVTPGRHKVMVTLRGYELEEQTITVAPGGSMSLNFSLKKAKKKWYQTWWFYTTVGVLVAGGVAGAFIAGADTGGGDGEAPAPTTGSIPVTW